jgi:hypothetical protein
MPESASWLSRASRIGRGSRGVRAEPRDGLRLSIARPDPPHPALVGDVPEHGPEALDDASARERRFPFADIEAVEPERDERDVAHFPRAGGDVLWTLDRREGRARLERLRQGCCLGLGQRGWCDGRRSSERHRRGSDRPVCRSLLRLGHGRGNLAEAGAGVLSNDELGDDGLQRRRVDELLLREEGTADGERQLPPVRVPVVTLRREHLEHDRLELDGDVRSEGARGLHDSGADDLEKVLVVRCPMERTPGQRLPEDDPERVEVAATVDLLAACLLGGHVAELALDDPLLGGEHLRAGDAEVGDLHAPFERQEDVLRRDVSVDDLEWDPSLVLPLVGVVEPLRRLGDDPGRRPRIDPLASGLRAREEPTQIGPFHVLHRQELPLVPSVVELVDLHHVRMVEARGELRLLDEHGAEPKGGPVRGQDALYDEHLVRPLGAALLREKHLGHSSRTEATNDLERRKLLGRDFRMLGRGHEGSGEGILAHFVRAGATAEPISNGFPCTLIGSP